MLVTDDELSEELKAARNLLSGSLYGADETLAATDRYCNPKDALQAKCAAEEEYIVADRKSEEELDL